MRNARAENEPGACGEQRLGWSWRDNIEPRVELCIAAVDALLSLLDTRSSQATAAGTPTTS